MALGATCRRRGRTPPRGPRRDGARQGRRRPRHPGRGPSAGRAGLALRGLRRLAQVRNGVPDVAQALAGVPGEATAQQPRRGGGVPAGRAFQSGSRPQHRREDVAHRLAREQPPAGEHLVEQDAEGPDVGALVDGLAPGLLGRHVGGRAEDDPGGGSRVREVGDWDRSADDVTPAASPPHALARPKSRTLTLPSGVTLTFAGLRSRWTMPFSCASSRASAICFAMATASSTGIAPAPQPLGEVLAVDQLHDQHAGCPSPRPRRSRRGGRCWGG